MSDDAPRLNLYAQPAWHGAAWIAGNRAGLVQLRLALEEAIDKLDARQEPVGARSVFATDGEGYDVFVVAVEDEGRLSSLTGWYVDEAAADPGGAEPADFVDADLYASLIAREREQGIGGA